MDTLNGTPKLERSYSSSFNSIIKSILVLLAKPFNTLAALTFSK